MPVVVPTARTAAGTITVTYEDLVLQEPEPAPPPEPERIRCTSCGDRYELERMAESNGLGGMACQRCRERYTRPCQHEGCERDYYHSEGYSIAGVSGRVCAVCFDEHYRGCSYCGDAHRTEEMTQNGDGGGYYCPGCMERRFFQCAGCRLVVRNNGREDGWEEPEPLSYCRQCFAGLEVSAGRVRIPSRNASGQDIRFYDVHTDRDYNNSRCDAPHREFTMPLLSGPLPQEQRIEVVMGGEADKIAKPGQDQITAILRSDTEYRPEPDFDWVYKSPDGMAFPKRVSKYYHKKFGVKLRAKILEQVGNIAAQNISKGSRHVVDFTRHLSWNAGMFGDSGSCYWGSNYGGRCMLKAHGGMAIRAWDGTVERAHGVGRAWLFPLKEVWYSPLSHRRIGWDEEKGEFITVLRGLPEHKGWEPVHDTSADGWVMFNAYNNTKQMGYDLAQFALLFSHMMGMSYKKISLTNCGAANGDLYINGGTAYLIGSDEVLAKHERFDLRLKKTCGCSR